MKEKDGIFLINKESGPTSRDIVNQIMKKFNIKKVGHAGTLDPFADGLLLISINHATKITSYLENLNKTYLAKLSLGKQTATGDLEGEVILEKEVPSFLNASFIKEVFTSFVGKQKQIPPMYSALKKDGKPLYKYARAGLEVERKAREIEVYSLLFLSYENNVISFLATVSKGTYLRTLGEDIAVALKTCGHLSNLTRLKIGEFSLENAASVSKISEEQLLSIKETLFFLPQIHIDEEEKNKVLNGVPLKLNSVEPLVLLLYENSALALYEKGLKEVYYAKRGLYRAEN
ncbi:MAG: tRNA pseudouridine(55) synthase TruB [Bacilli bacterium]|jgi:tRNA pseudouridine55 synthase|nr:tRNA pseudouridine(55) synthase TruB [Bacilli bacterium]NLN80117.1 tRNA pseudouridine(55) synthase TruB [Erysipelotrichia bacterium]